MNTLKPGRANIRFLALLLGLLLVSCAGGGKKAGPTVDFDWETSTADEVLERLQAEQKNIRSFSGGFSLTLAPPPANRPANLQGQLFFSRTKNDLMLRVRGMAPFGRTVFDLVQDGKKLQVYLPSEKTLYQGKPGKGADNPWARVFSSVLIDFSSLWAEPPGKLVMAGDAVVVPLQQGTLILDRASGLPREMQTEAGSVRFSDYGWPAGKAAIPMRVEVRRDEDRSMAVCRLSQVVLNQDLAGMFDLSAYRPEHVRDIAELAERP